MVFWILQFCLCQSRARGGGPMDWFLATVDVTFLHHLAEDANLCRLVALWQHQQQRVLEGYSQSGIGRCRQGGLRWCQQGGLAVINGFVPVAGWDMDQTSPPTPHIAWTTPSASPWSLGHTLLHVYAGRAVWAILVLWFSCPATLWVRWEDRGSPSQGQIEPITDDM